MGLRVERLPVSGFIRCFPSLVGLLLVCRWSPDGLGRLGRSVRPGRRGRLRARSLFGDPRVHEETHPVGRRCVNEAVLLQILHEQGPSSRFVFGVGRWGVGWLWKGLCRRTAHPQRLRNLDWSPHATQSVSE